MLHIAHQRSDKEKTNLIVYIDGLQRQWLFYVDYSVMKKDGTVWVIETKTVKAMNKKKTLINRYKTNSMLLELCITKWFVLVLYP